MSRSASKPKIIYKNLQEIIRGSSLKKKQEGACRSHRNTFTETSEYGVTQKIVFSSERDKNGQLTKKERSKKQSLPATEIYSEFYNQIDDIYTDLEDFLYKSK